MQEDGEVVVLERMGKVGAAEAMEEVRGGVTPNQIIPIINGETNETSEGGGGERAQRRGYTIW